jgi:hypothetical protein
MERSSCFTDLRWLLTESIRSVAIKTAIKYRSCRRSVKREKLRNEAPVNGGRNYNGPKVAKFLVG